MRRLSSWAKHAQGGLREVVPHSGGRFKIRLSADMFNGFFRLVSGSRMTSDGGFVVAHELDERCGLTGLIRNRPVCSCAGSDAQFPLADVFGQSASSQMAVYEDLYNGTRLARDPSFHLTMRDSSIGLGGLRLDGFVSLNPGPIRSRIVVSRPFISCGSKLEVIACILLAGSATAEAVESHGGTLFDIRSPGGNERELVTSASVMHCALRNGKAKLSPIVPDRAGYPGLKDKREQQAQR